MPVQLPCLAIERKHAVRVEIVPLAVIAVVLLRRIPGWPVDDVEIGIVAAGEPGGSAAMLDVLSLPCFGSRFSRLRNGPEPPHFFSCVLIVRRDEPVRAVLTSGHARDDQVPGGKRRGRSRIVL